jgi:hypothetical protein
MRFIKNTAFRAEGRLRPQWAGSIKKIAQKNLCFEYTARAPEKQRRSALLRKKAD